MLCNEITSKSLRRKRQYPARYTVPKYTGN